MLLLRGAVELICDRVHLTGHPVPEHFQIVLQIKSNAADNLVFLRFFVTRPDIPSATAIFL